VTRITRTLHEDLSTIIVISRWILLRTRNVSDKIVEKIKTHILCSKTFSRKSCRLWDNVEKYGTARQATDGNITRRMRFACWIRHATNTHSEYVIFIAFPRRQWLCERAWMLRYIYIACHVYIYWPQQYFTDFVLKLSLHLTQYFSRWQPRHVVKRKLRLAAIALSIVWSLDFDDGSDDVLQWLASPHSCVKRQCDGIANIMGKVTALGTKKSTPCTGPEGYRNLRLPNAQTVGTWKWEVCQPYAPAVFTPPPQEIFVALISVRGWLVLSTPTALLYFENFPSKNKFYLCFCRSRY
jgi:hypothetical protein